MSSVDRLALTLGMEPGVSEIDFIQNWRQKLKEIVPVDAETVSDGSLFQNFKKGKEVNLLDFPVPRWHELDGGRYIGTDDLVISRSPRKGG